MTKDQLKVAFSDEEIGRLLAGCDSRILYSDDPLAALARLIGDARDAEHPDQYTFERL
jgi:hypothetical protein